MSPMTETRSFRRKLFLYYFSIFLLFTVLMLIFQYHREKVIRISALDARLNDMSELVDNYIRVNSLSETGNFRLIDSIFNLMPVPVLDGGHILIMMLEGLARRDFSMQVKEKMLLAGFVVLMMLMVTVIYNDLTRVEWIEQLMPWRQ